ncbi:MAG: hypothetical protein HOV80_01715 [Polyangiaceae bacterium]|nr:hypothetical protein [Polyangiaceae bacterium]
MRLPGVPIGSVLVAMLVGCGDSSYPWEGGGSGSGPAPLPSSAPAASAGEEEGEPSKPRFEGGLFAKCAEGLHATTSDPVRDVTRLALACGPSTGMTRVGDGPHEGAVAEGTAEVRLPMSFEEGHCYRLFAVGDPGIEDLSVEIRSGHGTLIASDHREDRVAIVQPDRAVCAPAADEVIVTVLAKKGRGAFALEVWEVPGH